jgi:phosphohistidine swiveling domain-containing protein
VTSSDPARSARVAEPTAPARVPSAATSTFPVTWDDPGEASYTWTFERMHAPEPMTLADAVAFHCAFDHGATAAARAHGVPFRALTRRVNTYLYLALVPTTWPTAQDPAGADPLEAAIGRLGELWDDEYLPEIKRHLRRWESINPADLTLPQLVDAVEASVDQARRLYEIHFLIWFPFMSAISLFDDFYRDVLGSVSDFDPYRLLQGFENMTVASGRALWQLSRQALHAGSVRVILEQEPADAVTVALAASPEGRQFLDLLHEYLDVWGQRGDRWGWSFPSWIEDPTPVINTLRDFVRQPDRDLDGELAAQALERERLVAQSRERMRSHPPDVRDRFEFLLQAAQKAIVLTEDHSHWIDFRCMYHVHRISLEVGRRFSAAGVVDRPDDVFLLTLHELRETALELPRLNQRSRIAARLAEMEYFRHLPVPPTLGAPPPAEAPTDPVSVALSKFFGPPAVVGPTPTAADHTAIRGSRGSPGKATGPARVLHSLADASRLQPHDVLVVDTTAPPWTPLFATAVAVVSDTGGILSHCAVVAREYGIPAVVGTGNATSRITDGQVIEVDGDAGIVRLLS